MSEGWGRTGRVRLDARGGNLVLVLAGGEFLGGVWAVTTGWVGEVFPPRKYAIESRFTSLDAAVCWVLRRAAPDVWRAERPVVWRVVRGAASFPVSRWHVHAPRGHQEPVRPWSDACSPEHVDSLASAELANWYADVYARAEYAGTVAR
jgi:hypothetical protein